MTYFSVQSNSRVTKGQIQDTAISTYKVYK